MCSCWLVQAGSTGIPVWDGVTSPLSAPNPPPHPLLSLRRKCTPLEAGVLFCYMTKTGAWFAFSPWCWLFSRPLPDSSLWSAQRYLPACLPVCRPSVPPSRGNRLVLGSALRRALKLPSLRAQLGFIREPRAAMLVQMGWFQALGTLD